MLLCKTRAHLLLRSLSQVCISVSVYKRNIWYMTCSLQNNVFDLFGFPGGSVGKESTCYAGDRGNAVLILGLGRSPERRHGNPLQHSCLKNPMDRGAWQTMVHRITESDVTEETEHMHILFIAKNTPNFLKLPFIQNPQQQMWVRLLFSFVQLFGSYV